MLQYKKNNPSNCIKILKTLISSKPPVLKLENHERNSLMTVYRTYCEVLIGEDQRNDAINLLINLGNGVSFDSEVSIHSLVQAEKTFKQTSIELIGELNCAEEFPLEDLLLPNFIVDWISCYMWLISLTKTSSCLKNCYNELFNLLDGKTAGTLTEQIKESLWESVLSIIWKYEKTNFLYVKTTLQTVYLSHPENLKILNFLANNCIDINTLWLSINKIFLSRPSTTSSVFLTCVALDKFNKDKDVYQNRMKNLFNNLASGEGKLSAIVHCLRLRYLFEYANEKLEVAQLQAIDSCPWHKVCY